MLINNAKWKHGKEGASELVGKRCSVKIFAISDSWSHQTWQVSFRFESSWYTDNHAAGWVGKKYAKEHAERLFTQIEAAP